MTIGQKNIGPRIASKFDIPLIIYGENTAEYGASIKDNFYPFMPEKFYSSKQKDRDIYFGGKSIKKILKDTNYKINDFEPYMPLELKEVKKKRIEVIPENSKPVNNVRKQQQQRSYTNFMRF